jgi:hypothetical protein
MTQNTLWKLGSNVMAPMITKRFPHGRVAHSRRLQAYLENCRVHFSKVTEQSIIKNHILHVSHPLYSPDLAPSDFWFFGHVKTSLMGKLFNAPENLLEAVTQFLQKIQFSQLETVFSH